MNQFPSWRCVAWAVVLAVSGFGASAETTQEHVHHMSHDVMPFEMAKTLHIFKMTETGGVQKVIARDPQATDQIALIRRHLQHEAARFQRGNFGDPAALHGVDMPGLKELEARASEIKVEFAELPTGAQLRFTVPDVALLTSLHRWFGAQLSQHGADAKAE